MTALTVEMVEELLRDCQDYLLQHDHEFHASNPECPGCELQERVATALAHLRGGG